MYQSINQSTSDKTVAKLCCLGQKNETYTVHSVFFSKTLFDFKKSISDLIELKFSGKTPNEVLYAPIYFWGVYF